MRSSAGFGLRLTQFHTGKRFRHDGLAVRFQPALIANLIGQREQFRDRLNFQLDRISDPVETEVAQNAGLSARGKRARCLARRVLGLLVGPAQNQIGLTQNRRRLPQVFATPTGLQLASPLEPFA